MTVFFGIFSTLNLVSRYFCCQLNARHMPNWNAKRILEHVIDIIQCLVSTVPHNRALLMSAHEFCNIGSDNGIFQGIEIRLACRKTFRWILYPPLFPVLATHADFFSPIRNHPYVSTQILLYGWDPGIRSWTRLHLISCEFGIPGAVEQAKPSLFPSGDSAEQGISQRLFGMW